VVFSGGGLALLLAANAAPACLPMRLVAAAVQAALAVAAGEVVAGGIVTAHAAALADGVVRAMVMSKVKTGVLGLMLIGAGVGGGEWVCRAQSADPAAVGLATVLARAAAPADEPAEPQADEAARKRLVEARLRAERLMHQAAEAHKQAEVARRLAEEARAQALALEQEQRAGRPAAQLTLEFGARPDTELTRVKLENANLRNEVAKLRAALEAVQKHRRTLEAAAHQQALVQEEYAAQAAAKDREARARQQAESQQRSNKGPVGIEQQLERLAAEVERLKMELARSKAGQPEPPKK
jgi:hypothetical protein